MKQSEVIKRLANINTRDTAMRYVWRCGSILKDERIEVRTNTDIEKLGPNRYKLAQPEEHYGSHRFLTIGWDGELFYFHLHHGHCKSYRV